MPTYIYQCTEHGAFEITKRMANAGDEELCPKCDEVLRRVFGALPVNYNTDGFYNTDYKGIADNTDKATALRNRYKKMTGKEAPPPLKEVPRNGSEPY